MEQKRAVSIGKLKTPDQQEKFNHKVSELHAKRHVRTDNNT